MLFSIVIYSLRCIDNYILFSVIICCIIIIVYRIIYVLSRYYNIYSLYFHAYKYRCRAPMLG